MTLEDKVLLLKDLCARLPYHPVVNVYNDSWDGCKRGKFDNNLGFHHVEAFLCDRIEIRPYLRPLSSMTEEEREEYFDFRNQELQRVAFAEVGRESAIAEISDWFNEHHFDYRGLIEKGLAIEAV